MFQLFTIDGGDWLTFFATIISGLVSASMVFVVFLLTRDFQRNQDKESKNFQEKIEKESREFQEKIEKESREFQEKQTKESLAFQKEINDKNFKRQVEDERPYIVVEPLDLIFEYDSTHNKDLLNTKWVYEDDIQKKLIGTNDERYVKVYLRFKNIGKKIARNIEVENICINGDKLIQNELQNDYSTQKLPHQIINEGIHGERTKYSVYDSEQKKFLGQGYIYNQEVRPRKYKFEMLKSNDFIKIPIEDSDVHIINYFLFYSSSAIGLPKMKFNITYYDQYNYVYKNEYNLTLKSIHTVTGKGELSSFYKDDKKILLIAEIKNLYY